MTTSNALIDRSLVRIQDYLTNQTQVREERLLKVLGRLAQAFKQEGGPHFEDSTDTTSWKSYQADLAAHKEMLRVLSNDILQKPGARDAYLKELIALIDRKVATAGANMRAACAAYAETLQQAAQKISEDRYLDPSTAAHTESVWVVERANLRFYTHLADMFIDIREALA